MQADTNAKMAIEAMPHIIANMGPVGAAYVFAGSGLLVDLAIWLRGENVRYATFLVWVKTHFVPSWERYHAQHENIVFLGPGARGSGADLGWHGPKNETTIWEEATVTTDERAHPTQKPVALYERALLNSSALGDIVCDPFMGSGTMLIAAEKQNRKAFVMEIEPKFCGIAIARWERFTGKKATRETA